MTPAVTPAETDATDPIALGEVFRIGILLFDGVEPLDAIGPAQVFWSLESTRPFVDPFPAIEVHLVAEHDTPIRAGYGFVMHPTVSYADCPDVNVLIVPGGSGGADALDPADPASGRHFQARHEPTLSFVRATSEQTRMTASVCTGAFILAAAGMLAGRRANTHWTARNELVTYMDTRGEPFELSCDRVVDDGDILTAGGVSSGIELGLHIVERLFGSRLRTAASAVIEHETPPM